MRFFSYSLINSFRVETLRSIILTCLLCLFFSKHTLSKMDNIAYLVSKIKIGISFCQINQTTYLIFFYTSQFGSFPMNTYHCKQIVEL